VDVDSDFDSSELPVALKLFFCRLGDKVLRCRLPTTTSISRTSPKARHVFVGW